jgi:uncharacterized protein YbjT (DUF2867 family)
MTVSQMTATSTEESRAQRLHWLAEHLISWSGIAAVNIRPTVFLDNPLFTVAAARSIRDNGQLALPFGTGRTSPYAKALDRPITAARLPYAKWLEHLTEAGLDRHTQQHIATMARLHRDDRYNRLTHDVEDLTGRPAQSVQEYFRQRRELFT